MIRRAACLVLIACLGIQPMTAHPVKRVAGKPQPTEFMERPWLIGSEVIRHWQELPVQVNAPAHRARIYPGQHLTVAVGAKGDDRDRLLNDRTYSISITLGLVTQNYENLRPSQVRRIKAEGADFVLSALKAGKVQLGEAESFMSMVSLALFDLDWVPPTTAKDGAVTIQVKATASDKTTRTLQESQVDFWTYDRIAKEGGFKDQKEQENWMMGYYQHPEPTRLLHLFRASKDDQNAFKPNTRAFSSQVLKSDSEAAKDLLSRLKSEEPVVRMIGAVSFLDAGYSLPTILENMPAEDQERFKLIPSKLPPLPDPYDLVPDVNNVIKVPSAFDMLWSQFLATGDAKPVRAIAGALEWRNEGQAFLALRKSGKKPEGITLELAKGLSYTAAGWSLGSFYRNHPLVTDYIEAWKKDAGVPQAIREELGTLMTNEAFKKN